MTNAAYKAMQHVKATHTSTALKRYKWRNDTSYISIYAPMRLWHSKLQYWQITQSH